MTRAVGLIANGSDIAITKENRLIYIYLISHYRLRQTNGAFFEGLSEMIDRKWLRSVFVLIASSVSIPFSSFHNNYIDFSRIFNRQEVQISIGGVNSPIDL